MFVGWKVILWTPLKKARFVMIRSCIMMGVLRIAWKEFWKDDAGEFFGVHSQGDCGNKCIYSTVMDTVKKNKGGMYFVYGYGGNGKTYLYKNMSGALRSKGETLLNVASSGIATLFLKGGRTTHSRFAIPINVVEDSMCHIAADNDLDDLIRKAKLIEWDEAPMINMLGFII
ncbi:ATP-dependent DNA helicase PIF1-like protein [Tanacetum coccineum]